MMWLVTSEADIGQAKYLDSRFCVTSSLMNRFFEKAQLNSHLEMRKFEVLRLSSRGMHVRRR
jgi:hypothetical protein